SMASQRPPSSIGRPLSRSGSVVPGAGRPTTAVRPPPTAIRVATGMVPGTSGHPGMRGGMPTTGVLSAQIKVTDRPVTQQGLSGMKTGMKGPQRQILDKSYYLGLLRSKINELTTETSKLHKEIDNYKQENSLKKAGTHPIDVLLNCLNILCLCFQLVDKLNTNTEMEEMINDYNIVIPTMTDHRSIHTCEALYKCSPLNRCMNYLLTSLPPPSSVQELAHSHIKQEVVRLHETLSVLEAKRDAMEAEHKSLGSPQEEREQLFRQVSVNEQQQRFIKLISAAFIICVWQKQKYKELKRKEEEIDRYLESFEESRAQEQDKMTLSQENIVSLLEHCSRNMLRLHQVDTVTASELRNMQEVLVSKETEVVQSESTARGLTTESQRLQQDLEKVQQLEGKITGELSTLQERVSTMESELVTYRDLDALRHTAEEKKKRLQEDRVSLTQRRDSFRQLLEEMNQKYEALKTTLQENETHAQLANLERKWQHLEQNNFVMKEFIASKSQESDYASVATNVSQQVAEYNKTLIDFLQNK
uniref:Intraflagellar transport 74 n=1 Tax=Cyclopterus lumpus TaxID=8103 RepID=A0A8C3AAS6_CYCLU